MYIEAAVVQISLEHSSSQIQKCHELYNTLLVRHGVMLLGPTGGGKTSVIRLLVAALNKCYTDYYGPKSFHAISTEPSSIVIGSLSQVHNLQWNFRAMDTAVSWLRLSIASNLNCVHSLENPLFVQTLLI